MSYLKKYKFDELYTMSSGISSKPEQAGHGSPFVSFSTVFNNYFLPEKLTDLMNTSELEQETYSINKEDILLTRTSETIDELGMSCVAIKDYPKTTFSGFTKRLRPKQENITYGKYMGFYLRSRFFRKTMTNNAILTLRASLNEAIFSYLYLYLPDYQTQINIGDFLHLLSKKIELNNLINAELEQIAQATYNYWFVQFDFPNENGKPYKSSGGKMNWNEELNREIPESWVVNKIKDLTDVKRGKNITRKSISIGDVPVIAAGLEPSYYHNISNTFSPVITISGSGANAGYVQLHEQKIWASDCSYVDYKMCTNMYFLYLSLKTRQKEIYDMQKGSAQPHVYPQDILNMKIQSDKNLEIFGRFEKIISPLYQQVGINKNESKKLIDLRDWLLPMLMNGQVKVKGK